MDGGARKTRREFLRLAGGAAGAGAAFAMGGQEFVPGGLASARAATGARAAAAGAAAGAGVATGARAASASGAALTARAAGTVSHGIQHFRSRPDLRPPEIVVGAHSRSVAPGMILTDCSSGPTQNGVLIMDGGGKVVWFRPVSGGPSVHRAFNLRAQSYNGQPVLTWFEGAVLSGHGYGHYEICDQSYRRIAAVRAANGYQADLHEFLLTDSGTALFTCYGRANGRLPAAGGHQHGTYFYGVVQEVDVASGKLLFQWRSDEHVGFGASYQYRAKGQTNAWDYFHVNSIAIDPSDGNLLISARNTWAVYKVDRRTGNLLWTLGGKHSDFHMGAGTHFAFQHHASPMPGRVLTLFDNEGGPPNEATQSRGLVLAVDERARRTRLVRQYHHRPPVLSGALGSVQELADGHTQMGWGASGYFTEYGPGGRILFDGHLRGTASYRAFKQSWTGIPATAPAVAVARSGTGASLYASWNGATEVTRWGVLGGDAPDVLALVGVADKLAFETEIVVPDAPPYLAVQAIDALGNVLATSPTAGG